MNAIRPGGLADRDQAAKCHPSFLALVFASLLATLIVLTTVSSRALAADDCITEPKRAAASGGHWYYHVDRVNQRKCWYVGQAGMKVVRGASRTQSPLQSGPRSQRSIARRFDSTRVLTQEAHQQLTPTLEPANRDALFEEFLRWQKSKATSSAD
jgi:hypothetical protein